jgi:polar amino acid transport system substrate-binding protein
MPTSYRPRILPVATIAVVLLIAGCGSTRASKGSAGGASPTVTRAASTTLYGVAISPDSALSASVPSAVKSKGTLTVATDATYAPNEFFAANGKDIVGMDADLAKAIGAVLGLKVNVVNAGFDSILPGLAAGKYDLGMSSFGDKKEREKTVDFVTYFKAGTSFYVKSQGGPTINTLADLCGHKVAVERGTTQADDVTAQNKRCTSGGKPAAQLQVYPDQNGANLALSSGRADVGMADSPPAEYQVKQSNGLFKLVGQPYSVVPYGIAIPKNNGMAKPVLAAVQKLMTDGAYMAIISHWGIEAGGITDPVINGAVS